MIKNNKQKLSLTRPATYQIKVPGYLDEVWSDWSREMIVKTEVEGGFTVTTFLVSVDQAALHGFLRRLYSLGLPLISVICVDVEQSDRDL